MIPDWLSCATLVGCFLVMLAIGGWFMDRLEWDDDD